MLENIKIKTAHKNYAYKKYFVLKEHLQKHVHTTSSPLLFGVRKGNKMAEASSRPSFCNKQYNANTVVPLLCSQSCSSFCVASVGVKSRFCVKELLYPISPARYFQFLPCFALRWFAKSSVTEAGKVLNLTLFSDENKINKLHVIYYKLHEIIINSVKHITVPLIRSRVRPKNR